MAGNGLGGGKGQGPGDPPDQTDPATPPKEPKEPYRVEISQSQRNTNIVKAYMKLGYQHLDDRHRPAAPNQAAICFAKALNLGYQGALAPLKMALSSIKHRDVTAEEAKAWAEDLRREPSPETSPSVAAPKISEPRVPTPGGMFEAIKLSAESALLRLALSLLNGSDGSPVDILLAMWLLERAVLRGYTPAKLHLALQLLEDENAGPETLERAADLLREAADSGNRQAALTLAQNLNVGGPFPTDLAESRKYCEQAAKSGAPAAMWQLGEFYQNGIGGLQNRDLAYEWLKKAAEAGHEQAMQRVEQIETSQRRRDGRGKPQTTMVSHYSHDLDKGKAHDLDKDKGHGKGKGHDKDKAHGKGKGKAHDKDKG
jgi:TPR repeat protein